MATSATDPRIIRTRARLREALIAITPEKPFARLTVQDVTDQAEVNRTTFYRHYTGLHELLEDCARALFDEMRSNIFADEAPALPPEPRAVETFAQGVFRHLETYDRFYRAMLGKHGDPYFRMLFEDLLSEWMGEPIVGQDADLHSAMTLCFFSAGFAGLAAWWLEQGKPVPIEQAARHMVEYLLPDYLNLLGAAPTAATDG